MSRHRCLRKGCPVLVDESRLACDPHWLELEEWPRRAMWDALNAHGQASEEYGDAVSVVVALLRNPPADRARR